jgi:hypothetical protein
VTVTAPPTAPTFGPGPAGPFEATTATPYLGTSVAGKYAPTATDAVQGDISDAIVTYLAATNAPIALATYVFPLGTTAITHAVTNSRGITAQQAVTIKVVDTTKPALTVDNNVLVTQPQSAPLKTVHYPNRVRGRRGGSVSAVRSGVGVRRATGWAERAHGTAEGLLLK